MTRQFRQYAAISLALMLALTGQAMAVARGATTASGEIVICSGNGPLMISVDEYGQPTGPAHICPDFTLSIISAVGDVPLFATRPTGRKNTLKFEAPVLASPITIIRAHARAPPVL
ncbi:MAG: hypothetical protein Q9M48_02310 [Rhodobacterales bacterium]|nr:hypothetical protein [Rhodobacterales bacterium]